MRIQPPHIANAELKERYLNVIEDHVYAIQKVDPSFDKGFNDAMFLLIADGKEIRSYYIEGSEIGDPEGNRYYIQIC